MFLEVWQEPDGQWRWHYVEPAGNGQPAYELPSAEHYASSQAAVQAAETAYPGVPLRLHDQTGAGGEGDRSATGGGQGRATVARSRSADRDDPNGWLPRTARRLGLLALVVLVTTVVRRRRRRRDRA